MIKVSSGGVFRPRRVFAVLASLMVFFGAGNAAADKITPRRLTAGADYDYPPLSYLKDGLPTGFDRAYIDRMGELLRIPVDFRLRSWGETLQNLADGECDFISGCIETDARDEAFDFTIPYLTDQYYIFSNASGGILDAGDLDGKKLIVLADDAILDIWVLPAAMDAKLETAETLVEAFERLNEGLADYTVAPFSVGMTIVRQKGLSDVVHGERPLFPAQFRFAVRKGNGELLSFLNESISTMARSGETERLIAAWKIPAPESAFASVKSITPFFWLMLSVLIAFLLGLAWYYSSYFRFVKRIDRLKGDVKFLELLLANLPLGLHWESLDRSRVGENQLYRLYSSPDRKKNIRKKPVEITTMIGDPVGKAVILEDATRLTELETRLRKVSRELAERNSQLVEQNIVDPVSGLLNRGFVKSKIIDLFEKFRSRNEIFSVILVRWTRYDADPFSVRSFARRLKHCIGVRDFAGMVEPGLFAVLLPGTIGDGLTAACARLINGLADGSGDRLVECDPYPCDDSDERIEALLRLL